ncbi:MAG TPA: hypothetical protein GYA06_00600 [Chloroflexi bacterium]|jgi:hypothetical protein|nr:hypothetical protein [Chloroflexota bacterium]HPO59378.1 hypothetical protein [Anaerolineaceae bacterium]
MSLWISHDRETGLNVWAPVERQVHRNPWVERVVDHPAGDPVAQAALQPVSFWRRVIKSLALALLRLGQSLLVLAEGRSQLSTACE